MKIATHQFSTPTQCVLWKEPKGIQGKPADMFEKIETYLDDSHLIRRLLKCRECGQLYFYEMYEEIDWADGEDPIYRTYVPVGNKTELDMLKETSTLELLQAFPSLRSDFPKGAKSPKVYWTGK
jgi:hypothetical protein